MKKIEINRTKISYVSCTLILICIAVSCMSESKIIDRSGSVLSVLLDSTKVAEFKYSEIFKSVTVIGLDNKEALLGDINKMQVYKNQLLILDKRSPTKGIYIFDREGNHIRKIGRIGLAPGEYASCDDFTINTDKNELYIFDSKQNKIHRYDISSGIFKGVISIDKKIHFHYIKYNSGCLYGAQTFFQPSQQDKEYFLLQEIDILSGERVAQYMKASEYNKGWNDELVHGNIFYPIGEQEDLFFMGFMDTIMSIKDQIISPYMVIQSQDIVSEKDILEDEKNTFDPIKRGRNTISLITRLCRQGKIGRIFNIFKYKDELFFECMRRFSQQVRYDYKSKKTFVYDKITNDLLYDKRPDHSHIPTFLCSDTSGVYFCVTSELFSELQYFEKEKYLSDKLINKEYIRNLGEDTNPLILYYEFK